MLKTVLLLACLPAYLFIYSELFDEKFHNSFFFNKLDTNYATLYTYLNNLN